MRIIAVLFFLGILCIGCADPLPLDEVSEDQKLMLWSESMIGGEITARLQRTTPLDGSVQGGVDSTAEISIRYTDGIDQIINLLWDPARQLYTAGDFARLKADQRTVITARVEDAQDLNVEATMIHPRSIKLDSVSVHGDLQVRNGKHALSVSVYVPSQPLTSLPEYYHIIPSRRSAYLSSQGVEEGPLEYMSIVNVWNDNLVVQPLSNQPGILVDASRLNGEAIELDLLSQELGSNETTTALDFEVRSVSEDYYYFHAARSRMLVDHTDPNQTPVIMTGNVKNGYGLYSSYITTRFTVDL